MPEYEWDLFAEQAVRDFGDFIDVQTHQIGAEHTVIEHLSTMHNITVHLEELVPMRNRKLHKFIEVIGHKLIDISNRVGTESSWTVHLREEESKVLDKLKKDLRHKKWKAVMADMQEGRKKKRVAERLSAEELKQLQAEFNELSNLIGKSNLEVWLETLPKQERETVDQYFRHVHTFAETYEHIFRDLWLKELYIGKKHKLS